MNIDKPIEVVCCWDSALDMTQAEREEYARKRDKSLLRCVPGEEPTTYIIRAMSMAHMRYCSQATTEQERNARAFACAVEAVRKPRLRDGSRPTEVSGTIVTPKGLRVWGDDDMDALGNYPAEQEIGGVAYAHSYFPPSEERRFPLPPSWDPVWEMVAYRHAEKLRRDAATSSIAPSSEPTLAHAPNGDAPTAAPVTG